MLMSVVSEEKVELGAFKGVMDSLVEYSVPVLREKGGSRAYSPNVEGHDYIVASWGNGSFYTFHLAEKVWMALGLTPRCLGNSEQRLVYDDLRAPVFGVAEGEVSAYFEWKASRNVTWRMSNEYLRKYLWLRGAVGVRTFFYQVTLESCAELRKLMDGSKHVRLGSEGDWYEVHLQEQEHELRLEVRAAVAAVPCELCHEASADGLVWPGIEEPVTKVSANAMLAGPSMYLDDGFLERYEQSLFYDTVPYLQFGQWGCSPSYRGQWSFSECTRRGRNLIKVPIRELYKPKPDREIVHAHAYVLASEQVAKLNLEEEHVVSKTHRLLAQILELGDNLSKLGSAVGVQKAPMDWVGFSRAEIEGKGWAAYGQLSRLAKVAPLEMTQQAFLSRCKGLHEVWQRVPDGLVRQVLEIAGCPKKEVKDLKSLKLLQALLNIVQRLDDQHERPEALQSTTEAEGWSARNPQLAPLFLNNDLRIADAHEAFGSCIATLQDMGFETASLNQGYGRALDFVFDGVIASFEAMNGPLRRILDR
ncbi:hypothetical protein SAMN03159339_6856 [Variovorax sp. 770b2]|nr:hypothetical protein SAMN03159339_6856 [Variovorax sp. 770b2]